MWNGYDARLVDSDGAQKNGIEKVRAEMAGRGVRLDVERWAGVDFFEDGVAITSDDLNECAKSQNIEIKQGDFVIVRTGQMEQRLDCGEWGGYAGGDAPGLAFDTAQWIYDHEIAAICTDPWGCEVRPTQTKDAQNSWTSVVMQIGGRPNGEVFTS